MATEILEKKVDEAEFIDAIKAAAEGLGFKGRGRDFLKGKEQYRIQKIEETKHEYGEGGHRTHSVVLYRVVDGKEEKILETLDSSGWTTLSDDSEDYPEKLEHSLILYSEDQLGREAFLRMQELKRYHAIFRIKEEIEKDKKGGKEEKKTKEIVAILNQILNQKYEFATYILSDKYDINQTPSALSQQMKGLLEKLSQECNIPLKEIISIGITYEIPLDAKKLESEIKVWANKKEIYIFAQGTQAMPAYMGMLKDPGAWGK